jgi:hypothetical protein
MHLEENKVKWAEMFYQRALTADPQYALAEVGMAKLAALFKNRESCEEHLAKANVMAPDDPVVQKAIEEVRNPKRSSGGSAAGSTAPADDRKGRRK